jgi:hypothetical protein
MQPIAYTLFLYRLPRFQIEVMIACNFLPTEYVYTGNDNVLLKEKRDPEAII